jgi:outer membrane protein assembly factor BamB
MAAKAVNIMRDTIESGLFMRFGCGWLKFFSGCRGWRVCKVAVFMFLVVGGRLSYAGDWPMRLHDARRSGVSSEQLGDKLKLVWVHNAEASPAPAWRESPAKQDFWQRYFKLKPRQNFDRCFDVAVVGGLVYFGSSRTGVMTCLRASDGKLVWRFFSGGPIRFAPQVAGGRVYFGSDDGWVYCLSAQTGKLIWKDRAGDSDRMIWGNQQMISVWPVRTSVLVVGGDIFWAVGMFSEEGVYLCRRNAADGRGGWKVKAVKPHQGYLLANAERLFVPSGKSYPEVYRRTDGRHLAGIDSSKRDGGCWALLGPEGDDFWFGSRYSSHGNILGGYNASSGTSIGSVSGANTMIADGSSIYYVSDSNIVKLRRSDSRKEWSKRCANARALIKSGKLLYVGGANTVSAVDAATGAQIWRAVVDGVIYGLAVADGRLFASADNGRIYVFSAN